MSNLYFTDELDINSSSLDEVYYNKNTKDLFVTFQNSDYIYKYSGVPQETATALENAGSQGRYYAGAISGKFTSEKLYYYYFNFVKQDAPALTDVTNVYNINVATPKVGLNDNGIGVGAGNSPHNVVVHVSVFGGESTYKTDKVDLNEIFTEIGRIADMLDTVITVKRIEFVYA